MAQTKVNRKAFIYQTVVTAAGLGLWALATFVLLFQYSLREHLIVLAVIPLVVVVGMSGELTLERVVVDVRTERLQLTSDLGVLCLLTAAPHA